MFAPPCRLRSSLSVRCSLVSAGVAGAIGGGVSGAGRAAIINRSTPGTAGDAIQQAIQNSAKHPGGGSISTGGSSGPLNMGGVDILSDTQGVNFEPYLRRVLRQIYQQWLPLIPEEARPPLSKQGVTQIRFSIGPGDPSTDSSSRRCPSSLPAPAWSCASTSWSTRPRNKGRRALSGTLSQNLYR